MALNILGKNDSHTYSELMKGRFDYGDKPSSIYEIIGLICFNSKINLFNQRIGVPDGLAYYLDKDGLHTKGVHRSEDLMNIDPAKIKRKVDYSAMIDKAEKEHLDPDGFEFLTRRFYDTLCISSEEYDAITGKETVIPMNLSGTNIIFNSSEAHDSEIVKGLLGNYHDRFSDYLEDNKLRLALTLPKLPEKDGVPESCKVYLSPVAIGTYRKSLGDQGLPDELKKEKPFVYISPLNLNDEKAMIIVE